MAMVNRTPTEPLKIIGLIIVFVLLGAMGCIFSGQMKEIKGIFNK